MILNLYNDVYNIIFYYLTDNDFINLIKTNKFFYQKKKMRLMRSYFNINIIPKDCQLTVKKAIYNLDYWDPSLLNNITKIILVDCDFLIDILPKTIQKIKFYNFRRPLLLDTLSSDIKNKVSVIRFNFFFRISLNVEEIKSLSLLESLPLKELWINNYETNFKIPKSLKYLYIGNKTNILLPDHIKSLIINRRDDYLDDLKFPINLKYLILGPYENFKLNNLPESLEVLILGDFYDQPLDNLPNNLKHLNIGMNYSHHIDNLPDSIEILKIKCFLENKKIRWPGNLKYLELRQISEKLNVPTSTTIKINKTNLLSKYGITEYFDKHLSSLSNYNHQWKYFIN